jgi:RimJ/RimL family protein N-acetyltransferase
MIKLTPASISDIPIIYKLAVKIWNHHYVPIVGKEQVDYMLGKIYSTEGLTEQMTLKQHFFYLILSNEQPVGFMSVSGEVDMFIHKFYIDQDIQGRGYGEDVFNQLCSLYPSLQSFTLTVNRNNFKSINFYFKLGFKIDHVADFDIGQGYFMNDFVMKWGRIE